MQVQNSAQFTSIGQVFHYEILLIKLSGGLLFEWPNRSLAVIYRISMVVFRIYFTKKYSKLRRLANGMIPAHTQDIVIIYATLGRYIGYASLIYTVLIELRHRDLMPIILNKRFDRRYHTSIIDEHAHNDKPTIKLFKRTFLALYLGYALLLVLSLETGKLVSNCNKFHRPNSSLIAARDGHSQTVAGVGVANLTQTNVCHWRLLLDKPNSIEPDESAFVALIRFVPNLVQSTLIALLISALNLSDFDGIVMVQLMTTASMTDMLRRANEQRELASMRPSESAKLINRLKFRAPTKFTVQTHQLLVQVRDVLTALRQAFNLNYVLVYARQLAGLSMNQGLTLSLVSIGFYWLACVMVSLILLMFGKVLVYRLVHERLHDQVDQICRASQCKLVSEQRAKSRVELSTNLRLASDIKGIWPNDWINADVKSFLVANVSVFVFVVGFHQIAEKSVRAMHTHQDDAYERGFSG